MLSALRGRDLITLIPYTSSEIELILRTSRTFKERHYSGERYIPIHVGKSIMMIFEKPSTRTRVSIEVAARQLGMSVIYASPQELQLSRGETIEDTARVLSRYVDGIAARVYRHETLEALAEHSAVPVINALSNKDHPLQALADALTIWEVKGRLHGIKLAFLGDGNSNVARSLIVVGSKLGWSVRIVCPKEYRPDDELRRIVEDDYRRSGGELVVTESIDEGVKGVDIVYTDVWVSMGFESEAERRRRALSQYRVTMDVMRMAGDSALFMHCLPARRGEEVTSDVIDSPRSIVWQQAENRLHTAKAALALLIP